MIGKAVICVIKNLQNWGATMAIINGTTGDETLTGTPQDDTITTLSGNDIVNADAGDDLIIIDENGQGTIDGGAGTDTVRITSDSWGYAYYDPANNLVYNSTAVGVYTISNVEIIEGYGTNGTLNYYLEIGGTGADTLDASIPNAQSQSALYGLGGNDTLTGGSTYTDLFGGDGNDIINMGSGGGRADGGAGADTITAGAGFDTLDYSQSSAGITIDLQSGAAGTGGDAQGDIISGQFESVFGSNSVDTITGSSNGESIYGLSGDDVINGGDGDDILIGNGGMDTLTGGNGNDTFQYYEYSFDNAMADTITDFAIGDRIEMQQGDINGTFLVPIFIGTAAFSGVSGEMRYEKTGGQTLIHLDISGDSTADQTLTLSNGEFDLLQTNVQSFGFELIIDSSVSGTSGNDTLNGTVNDDIIFGLAGNDTITTLTGNDTIDAGADDDIIIGDENGTGTIDGGTGTDLFQITFSNGGFGTFYDDSISVLNVYNSSGSYQVTDVERYEALDTSGNATQVTIIGDGTNDVLDASAETVNSVVVYGAGGNDTITGTGSTGFDQLYGGSGNDLIYGLAGGDIIYGGDGNDQLFGGAGDDSFIDERGINVIDGGADYDQLNLFNLSTNTGIGASITASASDTFIDATSGASWQLNDVELITLLGTQDADSMNFSGLSSTGLTDIRITQSAGADSTTVNGVAATFFDYNVETYTSGQIDGDIITGLSVIDTIQFSNFDTNDSINLAFIGTAAFSNAAGEIRYTKNATDTVIELDTDGDGVADETLMLTEAIDLEITAVQSFGAGAESISISEVQGTAGPDTIQGTPGDDFLNGLAGDDIIMTFTGTDTVDGGADDDLIIIDPATQGTIDGGSGFDTVQVTTAIGSGFGMALLGDPDNLQAYTIGPGLSMSNVERVEQIDSASGNLIKLLSIGSTAADTINLTGDVFVQDGQLIITTGDGDDVVTVDAAITATTTVYQGNGSDTFTGGNSTSIIYGSAGADTITGGAASDTVDYSDSAAGVTVDLDVGTASGGDAQGDILSNIEVVFGSQTASNTLTGDASDNSLYGGVQADVISGGDGDDFIVGGLGVDTMTGGAGDDIFFTLGNYTGGFAGTINDFEVGDVVAGTVAYDDFVGFFQIQFIGTAAFSGVAGEMRFEKVSGQTLIHLDTTGDSVANETLTLSNGEFDLVDFSTEFGSYSLGVLAPVTPNLVTTTADEFAEDTDLLTQGNDGDGLSLREAIAVANDAAGADVINYDANVAGQILNTSPNGTIDVTDALTLSSNVTIFHEAGDFLFDISGGTTFINEAIIFTDSTNSEQNFNLGNGIRLLDANTTFTNSGTIGTNAFGANNEDRSTSIVIEGQNATVNNLAGGSIVSQGRYAVYSFDFDDNTNAYIPDFLTVNNDGVLEAGDDTIRIGTGEINNTGTIRSRGELDFGGIWTPPGLASDAIAIVNDLDASFVPGPDGLLVVNNSSTGLIEGARAGIQMQGGGTVNNDGTITGDTVSILTGGFNDFSNIFVLNNTGLIEAGTGDYGLNTDLRGAVFVNGGLDSAVITNSGTIQSGHFGISALQAVDLTNTATGQIIGDTDNNGDGNVSFYGIQEVDYEVETTESFPGPFQGLNFISAQTISIDANGQIVTSVGTYNAPGGQVPAIGLTNVDAPIIFPLIDLAATQASTNGELVWQTDGNGVVYPATINVPTTNNGTLTVTFTSGQPPVVTDGSGNTVFAVDLATDYDDSIDNRGLMDGDIITGLGNDAIINRGNITGDIYLGLGNDNYTAGAAGLSGDIYGGTGNDVVNARGGDQSIFGEDGNDFLRGGEGNDSLDGGFGADWLRGGQGADVLNGWAGTDWADYITSSAAVTVDLAAGVGTGGDAQGDTYLFIERVYGSNHNDTITGNSGVNYLRGAGGNDVLNGGGGVDYLQGDAGADALDGGAGGDYAYYASSTSGLTIDLGNPSNSTGEAAGDTYVSIENVLGSRFDDIIYGDANNNFLRGLEGNDQLFGGDGADFLRGDQGADALDGGNGFDWAYYATSNAAVTIDLAAGTASGGHATGDTFTSIERVFGSVFGDMITGDGGSNFLRGFSGNDTLIGGSGIDFLQGDAGVDVLDGGAGTDWAYYLSAKTDLTIDLSNSANNTGEAAGDTYISIESVLGGRFNDTITGDAGDNYLRGFTGDDIITGGAGNDTLRGDAGADTFVFVTGTGSDTVIDYNDADDMLDFSNFGFTDVNDALSNAADVNGDVVFTIGSDVITIEDTTVNDIMDNMIV